MGKVQPMPAPGEHDLAHGEAQTGQGDGVEMTRLDDAGATTSTNQQGKPLAAQIKGVLSMILANSAFNILTTGLTVYALFGDDLKLMMFPHDPAADDTFVTLSSIAFFLFIFELLLSCYAKDGYFPRPQLEFTKKKYLFGLAPMPFARVGSFYFYLDIVATVSLIFELPWLLRFPNDPTELDLGDISSASGGTDDDGSPTTDASALQSARAGRASRAGARAGRIVRIVRMVRLVRLVKILKVKESNAAKNQDKVSPEDPLQEGEGGSLERQTSTNVGDGTKNARSLTNASAPTTDGEDDILGELLPESHVGKTMSDLTTRRVIVGVLSMLILLPLVTYTPSDETALSQARLSHTYFVKKDLCDLQNSPTCSYDDGFDYANDLFKAHCTRRQASLVQLSFSYSDEGASTNPEPVDWLKNEDRLDKMRYDASQKILVKSYTVTESLTRHYKTYAVLDRAYAKSEESLFSFLLTWFVILLLGVGTMVFASDTERLVINPIEHMMRRVTEISENPLSSGKGVKTSAEKEGMETTFLLKTIDKIGNLMRIGFGEAGAEIIAANLQDATDDRLNVDAILRGRPIHSIFGFCDIRNFTDTTECLQEEVMTFVNKVAHILHNIVKDCNGAANKNIGDAFLLSWKLPENYEKDYCDLFDKALYAFLKFTVLLRRYDAFVTEFSAASSQRLYQRMPDYRCAMGMGLHVGEAVEGAIGTPQKIDATYISLHVNNSEFLESSTKAYKVPLLMSHFFYDNLSSAAKSKCRMVDVVKVTDTLTFQLWTYDIDYDEDYSLDAPPAGAKSPRKGGPAASEPESESKTSGGRVTKTDIQAIISQKDAAKADSGVKKEPVPKIVTFEHGATRYSTKLWSRDPDLQRLRHKMDDDELMSIWRDSIGKYVQGNWPAAQAGFETFQGLFMQRNEDRDGPADFLLKLMASYPGGQAPQDWDGSHA